MCYHFPSVCLLQSEHLSQRISVSLLYCEEQFWISQKRANAGADGREMQLGAVTHGGCCRLYPCRAEAIRALWDVGIPWLWCQYTPSCIKAGFE